MCVSINKEAIVLPDGLALNDVLEAIGVKDREHMRAPHILNSVYAHRFHQSFSKSLRGGLTCTSLEPLV